MVRVDDPPAVTEVGAKVAVAPAGRPLAENVTVCAEPLVTAVLMVEVTEPPGLTEPDAGAAVTEKSLPAGQAASVPATFTAVQAACTALYCVEHRPNRSVAADRV